MIQEMKSIVQEIWDHIGIGKIPKVETKKGGYTAAYYPSKHVIRFRENSWNKLPTLAHKRLLVIHECFHAAGYDHSVVNGIYLSSFDLLSLAFYKEIYGVDEYMLEAKRMYKEYAQNYLKYVRKLNHYEDEKNTVAYDR